MEIYKTKLMNFKNINKCMKMNGNKIIKSR